VHKVCALSVLQSSCDQFSVFLTDIFNALISEILTAGSNFEYISLIKSTGFVRLNVCF
jgi:hypothetical protein